jgi:hypothetical protein
METKRFLMNIKKESEKTDTYTAWASTISIDRDNEVVLPSGLMNAKEFLSSNPVVFYDHAWATYGKPTPETLPIGKALTLSIDPQKGILTTFKFSTLPFAKDVRALVDAGILNTLSIGFIPHETTRDSEEIASTLAENNITFVNRQPNSVHKKWEMLEYSIVGVPSNRDAEIIRNMAPEAALKIKSILGELDRITQGRGDVQEPVKRSLYDKIKSGIITGGK